MLNIGSRNRTGPQGPIGPNGTDGNTWHFGNGVPGSGLGTVGDFFLNQSSLDVYHKTQDGWEFVGNLKGRNGKAGKEGAKGEKGPMGPRGISFMGGGSSDGDGVKGIIKTIYGELLVNTTVTATLVTYTVPAGKAFELIEVLISGPNIADYFIKEDAAKIHTARTYFSEFDEQIPFNRRRFEAGQLISVQCYNFRPTNETFNATLVGDLYSVA